MSSALPITDIRRAMAGRLFPSITTWNRLEARPRTTSFDRALRAEVRDPLWMLTKQWQMGEFEGSDAGSPVFAKLQMATTRLTKYRPDAHATQLLGDDLPFNAKIEHRPVPLLLAGGPIGFDLRLAMGRYWLKLTDDLGYHDGFITAYPIVAPDPTRKEDAALCANPLVWQMLAAVAGLAMDGGLLYLHLKASTGNHAYDGVPGVSPGDTNEIDHRAQRFVAWYERTLLQPPADDDAYVPPHLEYQFAASAPLATGEKVYVADEYGAGRLDWYALDVDGTSAALDPVPGSQTTGLPPDAPQTMIPIPVSFSGMPNTRWWTFEDNRVNLGDIDASTTDLAKLLFMEFALVYANDWFVIPFTLPASAIATIRAFVVTNVFGERFSIDAAGAGADADWQRWSMFTIDVRGQQAADTSLVLLPIAATILESPPTEDIQMIRDEVANMVWGVECAIPLPSGESQRGIEAARQTLAFFKAQLAARLGGLGAPPPFHVAPPAAAPIRYQVMNTVPENWIPFIPVHMPNDNRTIQLQRAALPRILDGDPDPPVKVQPRTVLLREGLDRSPAQTYFVFEEEVPRAGARLMQGFERTRWRDGRVYTWLRVRRQVGRGEGTSGLGFDKLVDVPVAAPPAR
jgi:hypothetical protein